MSGTLDRLTAEEVAQLRAEQASENQPGEQQEAPRPEPPVPEPPAPQPQPPAPEPEPAKEAAPEEPQLVDKRALDESRERIRKLREEVAEERVKAAAQRARDEERVRLIQEALQAHADQQARAAQPAPEAPPDWNTDPVNAIQYGFKTLTNLVTELDGRVKQVETGAQSLTQQQQQAQQLQELGAWGRAQEQDYSREVGVEEYNAAVDHLKQMRRRELQIGGETDPVKIENQLMADLFTTAHISRTNGKQFGQVLYELAQVRGWNGANGKAQSALGGQQGMATQTPATAATATERLIRGQEMARTVGAAVGGGAGNPGVQSILDMSEAEFAKYKDKLVKDGGAAALHNLLGA